MNRIFIYCCSIALCLSACKNQYSQKEEIATDMSEENADSNTFFKISLAQWSLHTPMQSGELSPMHFAKKAAELNFTGIEYVTQLYTQEIEQLGMDVVLDSLLAESQTHGVENVLIMIDNEGDLSALEEDERNEAVENHKKWVDAAQFLGCHAVRVNTYGQGNPVPWKKASIDGLTKLSAYAKEKNINVLVENHGGLSSHAELLVEVIKGVNMDNCGTLPDFGNFCVEREGGAQWDAPCIEEYPIYQGIEEMMPFAKAVSAKAYTFNEVGQETKLDYQRILKIVKDAGYTGYIGIEYEGALADPVQGIQLTRNLMLSAAREIN